MRQPLLKVFHATHRGLRPTNEDRVLVSLKNSMVAILDGHGGTEPVEKAMKQLDILYPEYMERPEVLFRKINHQMPKIGGCALALARFKWRSKDAYIPNQAMAFTEAIKDNTSPQSIETAFVGDCRILVAHRRGTKQKPMSSKLTDEPESNLFNLRSEVSLSNDLFSLKAIPLTEDHLPTNAEEFIRLTPFASLTCDNTDAGGQQRIDGRIQITRGLGDKDLESKGLIAIPELSQLDLDDSHPFVALVTDGIASIIGDQEIIDILAQSPDPQSAVNTLLKYTDDIAGQDNATVALCVLQDWLPGHCYHDSTHELRTARIRRAQTGRIRAEDRKVSHNANQAGFIINELFFAAGKDPTDPEASILVADVRKGLTDMGLRPTVLADSCAMGPEMSAQMSGLINDVDDPADPIANGDYLGISARTFDGDDDFNTLMTAPQTQDVVEQIVQYCQSDPTIKQKSLVSKELRVTRAGWVDACDQLSIHFSRIIL